MGARDRWKVRSRGRGRPARPCHGLARTAADAGNDRIVDFLDGANGSISAAAPQLLDRVLLVFILIEIVHTVVLSLRAHKLVAQPFIVVGLIAVIRRILVVLTPGGPPVGAAELGLLIGMVAVFRAGLIAVSLVEKGADSQPGGPAI
jgi:uncharacterized membrane protein (DUF373 family)